MKWFKEITPRDFSVSMSLLAMLLVSSMTLREYAHFIDHAHRFHDQPGSAHSSFDHEAKFHFVMEAELVFEPPCWHRDPMELIQPLCDQKLSAELRLLPETRAPPASV